MLGFLLTPTRWFWGGNLCELQKVRFTRDPRICHSGHLRRIPTIVFDDGYVALDTRNRLTASERCNALILAMGTLMGAPSEPVTPPVLEVIEIKGGIRNLRRSSHYQVRNIISSDISIQGGKTLRESYEQGLMGRVFDPKELDIAIEFSNRILRCNRPALITRHLEVSSHFDMGNWTASLLLAWTIIEQALKAELVQHFVAEGQTQQAAEQKVWRRTANHVLEQLECRSVLHIGDHDPTTLNKPWLARLRLLKDLRNTLIHEGTEASCGDAKRMKKASERAMWRLFRQEGFEYAKYLDRIRVIQKERNNRLWGSAVRYSRTRKNPCQEMKNYLPD